MHSKRGHVIMFLNKNKDNDKSKCLMCDEKFLTEAMHECDGIKCICDECEILRQANKISNANSKYRKKEEDTSTPHDGFGGIQVIISND